MTEIVQIASSMGHIFRYCIKGEDIVPLREEIEIVRRYLEIIELRYRGKIRGTIDADEALLEEHVPKMILQPLVENAVFHGLEPKHEGGNIYIRVQRCTQDMIAFEIADDGIGINPQTVRRIENDLKAGAVENDPKAGAKEKAAEPKSRIGIVNIISRMRFLWGERAKIEMESVEGKGTRVVVYVPTANGQENAEK